jgi:uncharacterized cupin superfamily protein
MTKAFYSLVVEDIPASGMFPSELIATEAFTTDDTAESVYPFYHSEDGAIASGVWECAPCRQEVPAYPVNEMMTIISGSVTLTDGDGRSRTYGRGDSLFVPKGASFTWHITEKLKKYFMTAA